MKATFRTRIFEAGKTATGIEIPIEIVESFKAGKKPPVRITIKGYTYRNTVAVMGGMFLVGISAEHRKSANVAGGDIVDVTIELDTDPRKVTIPQDLEEAFKNNPAAKNNFEALSYSNKKGHILQIEGAKTTETRIRRIEKAVTMLNTIKKK